MATLVITPIPDLSQVRLNLDVSELTGITEASIQRVHPDGSIHEVRPYPVALSGGIAVLYDTEAPLDTAVHYRAVLADVFDESIGIGGVLAATVRPQFTDDFTRVVGAGGWGSSTPGSVYPWVVAQGPAANFAVNGTQGQQNVSTLAIERIAQATTGWNHYNSQGTVQFIVPLVTTGSYAEMSLFTQYAGALGNRSRLTVRLRPLGFVDIEATAYNDGEVYDLIEVTGVETYGAGTTLNLRYVQVDQTTYIKVWANPNPEPADFQAQINHSGTTDMTGGLGLTSLLNTGNTNPLPFAFAFDNLNVTALDTYDTVTLPSTLDGLSGGWLRDPLRPCNDLRLVFCPPEECPIASGIVLAAYGTETYAADAGRFPIQDRRRPAVCYATRKDAVGTIQLVTVTCDDRDQLLTLLEPGNPLLFQIPAEYCVPDRYLDIGNVDVSPLARDLRREWRLFDLPWVSVDSPGGPAQGVCGTRWMDLCKNWDTWDEADAAGLTIEQVLNGEATL